VEGTATIAMDEDEDVERVLSCTLRCRRGPFGPLIEIVREESEERRVEDTDGASRSVEEGDIFEREERGDKADGSVTRWRGYGRSWTG